MSQHNSPSQEELEDSFAILYENNLNKPLLDYKIDIVDLQFVKQLMNDDDIEFRYTKKAKKKLNTKFIPINYYLLSTNNVYNFYELLKKYFPINDDFMINIRHNTVLQTKINSVKLKGLKLLDEIYTLFYELCHRLLHNEIIKHHLHILNIHNVDQFIKNLFDENKQLEKLYKDSIEYYRK